MRSSGVKGVKGVKELRQQPYCLSPLLMIFFSQETKYGNRREKQLEKRRSLAEGKSNLRFIPVVLN